MKLTLKEIKATCNDFEDFCDRYGWDYPRVLSNLEIEQILSPQEAFDLGIVKEVYLPYEESDDCMRHWAEEYECAMMYLNDLKVPIEDDEGTLSLVGRISKLQTDKEKIRVYENTFHMIQMYREVAMNSEKLTKLLDAIGDWSYSHRTGNGMIDNDALVKKQFLKLKEIV